MSTKKMGIRIAIVVEDRMLERFVRTSLLLLGYQKREIRVECAPSGQGSGKNWVNGRIVKEVKPMRVKADQRLAVLAGTDVDELEIAAREKQLSDSLKEDGTGDRNANERIAYWLPRWSVETWLLRLGGENVDEVTKYKHQVKKPDYKALAKAFIESYRSEDNLGLQSLAHSYGETPRIEA